MIARFSPAGLGRALLSLLLMVATLWIFQPAEFIATAQSQSKEAMVVKSATISGRVAANNVGLRGVMVMLYPSTPIRPAGPVALAKTDQDGRFRLVNVAAGNYRIQALAPTYVTSETYYGYPGKAVTVDEGESVEGVNFTLAPGGVIAGRVADSEGHPVIGEHVNLERLDEQGNQTSLPPSSNPYLYETDERGAYRIYGLPPGRYRLSVGVSKDNQWRMGQPGRRPYQRTFYAGATEEADAKIVSLEAGGEATDVNITVGQVSSTFTVTGRVVDAESNQPVPGILVGCDILDREKHVIGVGGMGDRTNANGSFRLENLAPGYYAAYIALQSGDEHYAEQATFEISDSDVNGLEIKARRGASLSGALAVEGAAGPSAPDGSSGLQLYAFVEAPGATFRRGRLVPLTAGGGFTVSGLEPGKVYFNARQNNASGVTVLRIERNGIALSGGIEVAAGEQVTGVRVVVAYGSGTVRGRVAGANGKLPEGMQMVVSAQRTEAGSARNYAGHAQVDDRGRFIIDGLVGGEYELVLNVMPRRTAGSPTAGMRRVAPLRQKVSVTGDAPTEVTFTLPADAVNPEH